MSLSISISLKISYLFRGLALVLLSAFCVITMAADTSNAAMYYGTTQCEDSSYDWRNIIRSDSRYTSSTSWAVFIHGWMMNTYAPMLVVQWNPPVDDPLYYNERMYLGANRFDEYTSELTIPSGASYYEIYDTGLVDITSRINSNIRYASSGVTLSGFACMEDVHNMLHRDWSVTGSNELVTDRRSIVGIEYLALGDSYSSGEGDINDWQNTHYISGTEGDGQCHLSSRSYPYILRDIWGISSSEMKSVACSGSKLLTDYYGVGLYDGQYGQLADRSIDERLSARREVLKEFIPGVVRQIDFVKMYQPEKITFTGGGNDIGFADILGYCATSYLPLINETCAPAIIPQSRADLNKHIDDQYGYNKRFIEKIKDVSPATKIYMIGYPQFVSNGVLCSDDSPLLNSLERKMIRESVSRFNNILKMVARDTGIYYVDIEDSLAGGQICDGSKYLTGPLKLGPQKLWENRTQETYHPNDKGHVKMAEAIAAKINSGMGYEILDIPVETNGRKVIHTAVLPSYTGIGSTHTINVGPGILKPDGQVTIEMFSRPTNLGAVRAHSDGSLQTDINIPKQIGIGKHLITLSGIGQDDKPVVIQQFINIISSTPGDADADGISDEEDLCFAVSEWYDGGKNVCESTTNTEGGDVLKENTTISDRINGNDSQEVSVLASADNNPASTRFIDQGKNISSDVNSVAQNYIVWWTLGIISIIITGSAIYYAKRKTL